MTEIRIAAGILIFALLALLTVASSAAIASDKSASAASDPSLTQQHLHTDFVLTPWDMLLIAVIALFFASLGLMKDFHHYRGLLHSLLWNFYCWVFLAFTGACIFAVDYAVLPILHRVIQRDLMLHLSLALGHTGVSAAFAYVSPSLLGLIPVRARALADEPASPEADERDRERPTTEMNVVFAAIRESLENRVNGKVLDWTQEYSWPVIKSTGKMLIVDLMNSGMVTHEESARLRREVDGYTECDDVWDNRQRKYELLRRLMKRSSYHDLRLRLQRAERTERTGRNS